MGATYLRANAGGVTYSDRPYTAWPNVKADGKTDDSSVLNDLLARTAKGGGGTVVLPAGKTLRLDHTVTVPSGCQLKVHASTVLDFTHLVDRIAVSVSDHDAAPLDGCGQMNGPGRSTDTVGISVQGRGLQLALHRLAGFGRGLDLTHSDTFIVAVTGGAIGECGLCVDLDLTTAGANNSGERIVFDKVTFFNSDKVIRADGNGVDVYFTNCSIDYCHDFGWVSGGYLKYTGCHFETGGDAAAANGGYGWTAHANGHIAFANCLWIFSGTPLIVNPGEGPWNYNAGRVTFDSTCSAWFKAADGNSQTRHSNDLIHVDGTTYTGYTPFLTKWGPASVQPAANDGNAQADVTARLSAIDTKTGKFTITTSGPTWVRVTW